MSLNCFKLPVVWKYSRICDMSCLTFFLFQMLKGINLHKECSKWENLCDNVWNLRMLLYFSLLADHHKRTDESNPFMYKIYFFGSWQLVSSFSLIQFETAVPNLCKTVFWWKSWHSQLLQCYWALSRFRSWLFFMLKEFFIQRKCHFCIK